ncbi:MAG: CPBP family intramembrane metalloprotease [Chloroflexi bacterium]|nr:CPBP family intramembrane metalloprotease [Chloroflexota bacterium]
METESGEINKVPWTHWDVWLGILALIAWMLIGYEVGYLNNYLELGLRPSIFNIFGNLLLLFPLWWLVIRRYNVSWTELGVRAFSGSTLGLGCGLVLLFNICYFFYTIIMSFLEVSPPKNYMLPLIGLDSPWLLIVGGILVGPFVEEIFFRGFLFAGMRQRYGWQKAAMISAAFFALVHMELVTLIPIFGIGLIYAFLYQRSKSIWPSVIFHALNNGVVFFLTYWLVKSDYLVQIVF